MARVIKNKELVNASLATNYGGWMYCTNCHKNIGYLCYVTYDSLKLNFECCCGSKGSINIDFEDSQEGKKVEKELVVIKNRFCCPEDESPLVTISNKSIKQYELIITCKSCGKIYHRKEPKG